LKKLYDTNELFVGLTGEPLSQDGVKALFKQLKYYYPERTLNATTVRQSVVSYWVNDCNLSVLEVQQRAGFRYPSTVEKYQKIEVDEQRKLINKYHLLS